MQNLKVCAQEAPFSCAFMENLLNEGPKTVQKWFKVRCDDPQNPQNAPNDFNGWSQVAKRIACAASKAAAAGNQVHALVYADIACNIYEKILPTMQDELALMGFGSIGFNFTQVEAINIRIQIINRFGPQDPPSTLDVVTIEEWFFSVVKEKCNLDCGEFPLDFDDILKSNREVKAHCVTSHLKVVNRLDDRFLSPKLRLWIENFSPKT